MKHALRTSRADLAESRRSAATPARGQPLLGLGEHACGIRPHCTAGRSVPLWLASKASLVFRRLAATKQVPDVAGPRSGAAVVSVGSRIRIGDAGFIVYGAGLMP